MKSDKVLLRCDGCRSAFSLTEVPVRHYEDNYQLTRPGTARVEHRRVARLPEQVKLIRTIAAYAPAPRTLLDIGCDNGYFLDEARRFGYSVMGVEPSVSSRDYCNQIGLTVLPALEMVSDTFDIAVMWHSFEHFEDPNATIDLLRSKLTAGGYVFIRVPDYACVWSKALGSRWMWFHPVNHRTHFTASGLRQLLEKHGFTIAQMEKQHPSTITTDIAFSFASRCYGQQSIRKSIGRFVEHLTGVELFCVARA